MPVESVKFCGDEIASCGKDGKIVIYNCNGSALESWSHNAGKPFTVMENFKQGLLVANIEPKIMFFSLNPLINVF